METIQKKENEPSKFAKVAKIVLIIIVAVLVIRSVLQFTSELSQSNPSAEEIYGKALVHAQARYADLNAAEFKDGYDLGASEGKADAMPSVVVNEPIDSYKIGFSYGYSVECVDVHDTDQSVCQTRLLGNENPQP